MNEEELLNRLKDIHLIYSLPRLAQNMGAQDYAIVEYEKLLYEQQAEIDRLNNELKTYKEFGKWFQCKEYIDSLFKE